MSEQPYIESTTIEPYIATTVLAVVPTVQASELVERLDVIRDAMRTAMVQDIDYGVIPGTDKPALFKPGSEKLGVLFQLDIQLANEKQWGPDDHLTVMSRATVFHAPSGQRLGFGEGLCTTKERKYAYRKQERLCPSCGAAAVIKGKAEFGGGWLCWKKRDGCGAKFLDGDGSIEGQSVGDVANPDLPDLWNTVVKMAEKRARVDAVLAVTGASALFTQDVEDGPLDLPPDAPPKPSSAPSVPYVGDSDHAPDYVDRGGRDTRISDDEPPQDPKLVEAARGLALPAVQTCYSIAGLEPPTRKRDCFRGLDDAQVEALKAALENRRLADLFPSDIKYTGDELAPSIGLADDSDLPWGSAPIDVELDPAEVADARKRLAEDDQRGA